MYCDWSSLQDDINCDRGNQSVLHRFPPAVGREVACHVVKHIAHSLSIATSADASSGLQDEKHVNWTMEVLCFGLGLPLTEHETINNCVKVYVEWLTALLDSPKPCVPRPIVEEPNPFAQVMLHHLLNLFTPRQDSGPDLVNKQAVLCHRVIRAIETVAKDSSRLTRDTWEVLLKFLLAANDSLLSPPTEKDDISDHLCDRVLSVLFVTWLTACRKAFPSPSLWKTFRNMCQYWRHHEALVTMWHRVNHALTQQMILTMYGPHFPVINLGDEESQLLPVDMNSESVAQCWFRFLHILENPVDLSSVIKVSNSPKFLQHAISSELVMNPEKHPCLARLPLIFLRAMRGVAAMVNAFLGLPQDMKLETPSETSQLGGKAVTPSTPPGQRKATKTLSVLTGPLVTKVSSKSHNKTAVAPPSSSPVEKLLLDARLPYSPLRPQCNSLLHLFGAWLFDASLVGVRLHPSHAAPVKEHRANSFIESRHSSLSMDLGGDTPHTRDTAYQAGRAEACGALCRLFCGHKTGEFILPEYYSRFYIIMYYGLQTDEANISGEVLSNILFNSVSLLRVDLAGVQLLLPHILKATELVLSRTQADFKLCEQIPYSELRKAAIHLLLSMLCLPLHFKDLQIQDILKKEDNQPPVTFLSLRTRITELIRVALTNEIDSQNTQMLLGGLMLVVEDLATCEQADNIPLQPQQDDDLLPDTSRTSASSSSTEASSSAPDSSTSSSSYPPAYHRLHCLHASPPKNLDTAYGLFGHATSLVCNRLSASWKMDLNTALAAMELLSGLAKVKVSPPNMLMCKRTVKWMCDLIVFQCSRPAPFHSRDLHSMLCAAFKCLQLWLVEHCSLLYDRECLHQVLEVVELGISGSKSQTKPPDVAAPKVKIDKESKTVSMKNRASDPPKFKGNKELMPASMRVKDAAEALLTCIIDQVGSFPPPCGPESLFSLLDERSLLRFAKGSSLPEQASMFRYYVIDKSVIVGLLEQPLGNIEDPLPTVTALVRGAFGRHAWTMQLRHSPRAAKISSRAHLSDPGRPLPDNNTGVHHNIKHRYFPENVNRIPPTKADESIPVLESVLTEKQKEDVEKMKGLIDQVATFEKEVGQRSWKEREATPYPNPNTECKPPKICNEHQTARLFLSHYGLLSLEALKEPSNSSVPPDLVLLDTSNSALFSDLECLDFIPSRDHDTLHVFYMKPGQTQPGDILNNVTEYTRVKPHFVEFLHALGWPVDVRKHAGWTGHASTSWKITDPRDMDDSEYQTGTGGSLYDGRQQVLYWADVLSEMAVVVPSPDTFKLRTLSTSEQEKSPPLFRGAYCSDPLSKPTTLLLEAERGKAVERESPGSPPDLPTGGNTGGKTRRSRQPASMTGPDTKVMVVWLESFEDHITFPIADLLVVCGTGQEAPTSTSTSSSNSSATPRPQEKDVYVIFIHGLQNGLYRVHIVEYEKTQTKMSVAIPLVDGMVVSRRTLGSMVRQTTINICRRRRLESELYQPPHVRRKLKIQEIVNKYKCTMSPAEFYTALFQDVPK